MNRSVISCLSLAGVMLFSTAAFSQTMIDGKEVSAADLPKVQAACDALAAKGATASTDANASTSSSSSTAGTNASASGGIDLSMLTLDECKTAGLVKTP